MGVVLDAAALGALLYSAFRGWKNGIVRGVCGFLALLLSIIIANSVAKAYSGEFTGMIRPFVGGLVDGKIQSILLPDTETQITITQDETHQPQTYFLSKETLQGLGIFEPAARKLSDAIAKQTQEIGYALGEVITENLTGTIAYVAVFAVSFILLVIIFSVAGNLIGFAFSLPGLKLLDSTAGLVFGICRGLLVLMFVTSILRYLGIISADLFTDTRLIEYMINNNPVANALGI